VSDDPETDAIDRAMPPAGDEYLEAYEERLAERRASALAAAKRKGGMAGMAMAGAMLAISDIIEGPKKDDAPVTVEASGDPHDLEKDGFGATVGEVSVETPPLERIEPVTNRSRRR
jgi:hypothetical protein